MIEPFNIESASARVSNQRSQLLTEIWFHGFVSRQDAEALLTRVCILSCNEFKMCRFLMTEIYLNVILNFMTSRMEIFLSENHKDLLVSLCSQGFKEV